MNIRIFYPFAFQSLNLLYLSPTEAARMRQYRLHINELVLLGIRYIFHCITGAKVITINVSILDELICIKIHQIRTSQVSVFFYDILIYKFL